MLILASASPRRRELLAQAGLAFEVVPSGWEESAPAGFSPQQRVQALARGKAQDVARLHPQDVVIGADTLVFLDGEPLGKPHSQKEAADMLARLSGRTHQVMTGVCILAPGGKEICFAAETEVTFYPLGEEEIAAYIATGEPMDKAGAYGIQGRGAVLVRSICGDYNNVVGLPLAETVRALRELNAAKKGI